MQQLRSLFHFPTPVVLTILVSLVVATAAVGQNHSLQKDSNTTEKSSGDTLTLLQAFKKGKIEGHIRYFFMATTQDAFATTYANAIGGGIRYESAPFKRFRFGIGGFFIYNIGSSDLAKKDPTTGQGNRYEIGLFDITDPGNKYNIDRMEELYLKYQRGTMDLVIGAQMLNTPFINEQDGRMRPTTAMGVYGHWNKGRKTSWEGGYLVSISPRSTVRWYSVGNSIGIYPQGVTPKGEKGNYGGHTSSSGILLAGMHHKLLPQVTLHVWNQAVLGVFNTAMLQLDYDQAASAGWRWYSGLQLIRQDAFGDGGNPDQGKSYFGRGNNSLVFGGRVGVKKGGWNFSLNANRITAHGRYLIPREWGRDPFFTFLPRERSDGLGDATAFVAKAGYELKKYRLRAETAIGYHRLPAADQTSLNKYGLPSYTHWHTDIRYRFAGALEGFDLQLLAAHKWHAGRSVIDPKYVYSRVNMTNWNLVVNFRF